MKSRTLTSLAMVAALVATAPLLSQSDAKTPPPSSQPKEVQTLKANGTVTEVDAIASTVSVKVDDAARIFHVDSAARISRGGKTAKLADLKLGQSVEVNYVVSDNLLFALAIDIRS